MATGDYLGWTIETAAGERTFAELGLAEPQVQFTNGQPDVFTVQQPGAAFDDEPSFAYLEEVTIRRERQLLRGQEEYSGGEIFFVGRRMNPDASGTGGAEGYSYSFVGPWDYLEKVTFPMSWRDGVTYTDTSHVFIPGRLDDNYAFERLTTGGMIGEVIDFIASAFPGSMQKGTIDPALWIPVDEKVDLRCAEILRYCITLSPDAVFWFDYTTTPPTLHCMQRGSFTTKNIALTDGRIQSVQLRRRDDLVVPGVAIIYEQVNVDNGRPLRSVSKDVYPPGTTGFGYAEICQTVKLEGSNVVRESVEVEVDDNIDLTDRDWWVAQGLAWMDVSTIPSFTINPENRETSLPNILVNSVPDWVFEQEEATWAEETFAATVEHTTTTQVVGTTVVVRRDREKRIHVKRKVTDLEGGTYSRVKSATAGEDVPVGLAQAVQQSLSVAPYDGVLVLEEEECQGDVRLNHLLNITGGTGRYAAMNAIVQSVQCDLTSGRTTLQLGFPRHLGINDLVEMLRFNRTRRVFNAPESAGTGDMGGDNDVDQTRQDSKENAASGAGHQTMLKLVNPANPEIYVLIETTGIEIRYGANVLRLRADGAGNTLSGITKEVDIRASDAATNKVVSLKDTCAKPASGGTASTVKALRSDA